MAQDFLTDAFVRLRQKMKGVSGGILPDPGGAEDVLQDSFVQLWRRKYPLGSEKEAEALLARCDGRSKRNCQTYNDTYWKRRNTEGGPWKTLPGN